jgi:hypothetical protein
VSAAPQRTRRRRAAPVELCVLTEVGGVPLAVPARAVERLVAAAEATLHANTSLRARHPALLGLLESGDDRYVAWDLGLLLRLPSDDQAWVTLRLERPEGLLPLAFRCGRCSAVVPVASGALLPRALFHRRGAAFPGAFALPEAHAQLSPVGLLLEPGALLEPPELLLAQTLLGEAPR